MSWIRTVPDDQWDGELEPLHGRVVDRDLGRVDHIMAVHSINPRGLAAHDGLYRSAMAGTGTLRKVERELIAQVMLSCNNVQTKAAARLGINRNTLHKKLKEYRLD